MVTEKSDMSAWKQIGFVDTVWHLSILEIEIGTKTLFFKYSVDGMRDLLKSL